MLAQVQALTGSDYATSGAKSVGSSDYLRNSAIPNLHAQIQFSPDSANHVFGAGVDYKSLLPRTYTMVGATKYASDERINSLSAIAYAKLDEEKVYI